MRAPGAGCRFEVCSSLTAHGVKKRLQRGLELGGKMKVAEGEAHSQSTVSRTV